MSASLKYRQDRGVWTIRCHQFGQQWKQQVADEPTGRAVVKAINARMRKGEDLRPESVRAAAAAAPRPATPTDTVRAFGDHWLLAGWSGRKMSTNNSYERLLRMYVYPALGDMAIAKVTRPHVVAFYQGLLTQMSAKTGRLIVFKTRESIHRTLSALLSAALDANLILANPARRLDKYLRSPDEIETDVAVWTPTEADRFLETVRARRPDWYAFFFVALRTGLRHGELAELQWDLDFTYPHAIHVQRGYAANKRQTLTIAADGTRTRTEVPGDTRVTTPKSKRRRLVDTSIEVERVLAHHRTAQRAAALQRGRPAPSLVFTTSKHGTRVTGHNVRARIMGPLMKAARVPAIDIHGMRHTFASTLIARGERLDYVSRQLGHANITTTEQAYRHWIPEDSREAAARRARLDDVWKVDTTDEAE